MSLIMIDSFDHWDNTIYGVFPGGHKKWTQQNGSFPYNTSSGNGRNSTRSIRMAGWRRSGSLLTITAITEIVTGFSFKFGSLPSATSIFHSLSEHVTLAVTSGGVLQAWRGAPGSGTLLGSGPTLSINTEYYIETKVIVDAVNGTCIVRVDGNSEINFSGGSTYSSGDANITNIVLGDGTSAGEAGDLDFDDFYACNTSGSFNNTFLGDCRVVVHYPDGDGTTNDFTPSGGGTNVSKVQEAVADADTTRVISSADNNIDLYTMEDTSLVLGILGVATWSAVRAGGVLGGGATLRSVIRPTSTNYFGSGVAIDPAQGYTIIGALYDTNPDTSARWELSEIDATECGVQVTAGGSTGPSSNTQTVMEVLYGTISTGTRLTQYVVEALVQPAGELPRARLTQYVVELITGAAGTPGEPCAPTTSQQQTYPPCYGAEFDQYIAPDGHTYDFHVPRGMRILMTEEGFGMPPIQYVTSVGPYQHGETLRDWFLTPRIVQLMISNSSTNRQDYTRARATLLDAIRPNRQVSDSNREPGVLRKRLSDGSIRDLKVIVESGPAFAPRDLTRWDEYRFQEIIRFIAHDPILFNPSEQCRSFVAAGGGSPGTGGGTQLVFPCIFPITFGIGTGSGGGSGGGGLSGTLQYNGTWEEYPRIVVHGPVISVVIQNITTGERLSLETEIAEGETVTFDLTYAVKTVTRNDGTNMLGFLSDDSDLATFHLTTVNNGANVIQISGSGTNASTFVEFFYYERFIGR